jgi:hypothetical protein
MRGEHWRKSTNNIEGSQCRNYEAGFGTIFETSVSVFIDASRNFAIIVLLLTRQQNIKTKCTCSRESTD